MTDISPDPAAESDLRKIADGIQPVWTETFDHPIYGPLTFSAKLPNALTLAQQSVEMDNLLGRLDAEPRSGTMVLVAAIAGLKTLVDRPVIRERRVEEPENDHTIIEKDYYDPEEEVSEVFLVRVWTEFSMWRAAFLEEAERLGESSRETAGPGSNEPSTSPTDSPSTIPA